MAKAQYLCMTDNKLRKEDNHRLCLHTNLSQIHHNQNTVKNSQPFEGFGLIHLEI